MTRDLTTGDAVSATPHYNQDLTLPEPIDVIRFAPFALANYYKYCARGSYKGSVEEDLSKAIWYATDMAVGIYLSLEDVGRPWRAELAQEFDVDRASRYNDIHPRLTTATPMTAKIRALNVGLRTIIAYDTMQDARPMESVKRFSILQKGVLNGLRDMLVLGYAYASSINVELKPLSQLYLGTRGQDVPPNFFNGMFPNDHLLTHGR